MLNKCKFCGAFDAELMTKESKGEGGCKRFTYYVRCTKCHARGSTFKSDGKIDEAIRNKAVKAWNG